MPWEDGWRNCLRKHLRLEDGGHLQNENNFNLPIDNNLVFCYIGVQPRTILGSIFKSINYEDGGFMTKEEITRFMELRDRIFEQKATEQDHRAYRELKFRYDMWLLEEKRKLRASALAKLGLTEEEWDALMDR